MLGERTDATAMKQVLNDEIAVTATALAQAGRPHVFYCECDDLTCVGRVELTPAAFAELRRRNVALASGECLSA